MARLTRMMARRGPDDLGAWTDHRHLILGFRRLAVIDLSAAGHQPMVTPDGRYVLVFNGEVYNYRDLRQELAAEGIRFASSTDSEVVLQALATWGDRALVRFNGIFALGFYDVVEERLLLARDPMGVKPLYYLAARQGVVFASQYDQLLNHPLARSLNIDNDALQLFLRLGYIPAPRAMVTQTHMLRPGCRIVFTPRFRGEQEAYFSLPDPPAIRLGQMDAMEEGEGVLTDAVRRQMVSDVPLGVLLSGGVDSPLVAALGQEQVCRQLDAFTIGGEDIELDESARAGAIAAAIGVRHFLRRAVASEVEDLVGHNTAAFGEPFADHSSIPMLLVSEIARERLTVALSGDGGDELFFGYPRFRKVLLTRRMFKLPRLARVARYAAGRAGMLPAVPAGIRFDTFGSWYLNSHAYWTSADLAAAAPALGALPIDFDLYHSPPVRSFNQQADWLRRNEIFGHLQRVLLKVDRASMYHSLEVRVPLLDLEVVRFAMRVSPSACMTQNEDKAVLRALIERRIPQVPSSSPKRGFTLPVAGWLRGPLKGLVHDMLLVPEPQPAGLFKRGELDRMYKEHLCGRDRTLPLWAALSLQLWWHEHYETSG